MPSLHIHLLGDFLITTDQGPLTGLHQARLQSLLAYLLLHCDAPLSRRQLSFFFWPDSPEKQARTNLRKALYHLRCNLPDADDFVHADASSVQWRPDSPYELDVARFAHYLEQADAAQHGGKPANEVAYLEKAVEIYRGEFLPNCYDDWVLTEREDFHQRMLASLERLMQLLEVARDHSRAIHYGRRLIALDPLYEGAYRRLMRLHTLHNDRTGALRVYHTCADRLQRELGVSPTDSTQALYTQLLELAEQPHADAQPNRSGAQATMIGRGTEWRRLQRAWRRGMNHGPHLVLLSGEPGIGKSHLALAMRNWASQQGFTTAFARAHLAEGALAYAPVVKWLRSESLQANLETLEPVWRAEIARLLPELIATYPKLRQPTPLTEPWQRQRLFEALARSLMLAKRPLLLVLDDLQWCDDETLEWLHFLMDFLSDFTGAERTPLLIIGTMRPGEVTEKYPLTTLRLDLRRAGDLTEVELEPLAFDETAALAEQVVGHAPSDAQARAIFQASEGNPLFVVEMMQAEAWPPQPESQREASDSPAPSTDSPPIPPKVQAVIQSRLVQLSPPARAIVGLAATVGRAFSFDLLAATGVADEESVMQSLDELWHRRIVHEHETNAYDFSHDRIRDVAYASLSPIRRRHYHRCLIQAVTQVHADEVDAVSGELGFHAEHAQQWDQAMTYYRRAANVAINLYAFQSAIVYLKRILRLLDNFPPSVARSREQAGLWLEMADLLIITDGWTAEARKDALDRASRIAKEAGADDLLFTALVQLRSYHTNRGAQYLSHQLTREALGLASKRREPSLLCRAYCYMGSNDLQRGESLSSLRYFQRAQELAQKIKLDYSHTRPLSRMVEALWMCGHPDQARRKADASLSVVDEHQNPFRHVHDRQFIMVMYQRLGDLDKAQNLASHIIALCEQYGFPNYALSARVIAGWIEGQRGAAEAGLRRISEAIEAMDAINSRFSRPYYMALQAETQVKANAVNAALHTLTHATELVESSGDRLWEAELLRLTGDIRLRHDPTDAEAEALYQAALDVAQRQSARSLELRAATSLARLWDQQGHATRAHNLVAPIYGWFSEGFDTPDLIAARTLLNNLQPQTRYPQTPL